MKKFLIVALCIVLVSNLMACSQSGNDATPNKGSIYSSTEIDLLDPPTFDSEGIDPDLFDSLFEEATYEITYNAKLKQNNSVGNEWGYGIKYNDQSIKSGCTITKTAIAAMEITAFAIEYDSYNDRGSADVIFGFLEVGEKETQNVTVTVRENRGRYSGNTAKWVFEITVERIS